MAAKKPKTGSKWHPQRKKKDDDTPGFQQTGIAPLSCQGEPLFFWKEDGPNGWLYQWHRSTFIDPSSEIKITCKKQYMMYHKALNGGDTETAALILKTTSPRKQEGLGAKAVGFNEERWCEVRSGIVERGNLLKFRQGTNIVGLKMDDDGEVVKSEDLLLGTGKWELVEASPFDRVWGIEFSAEQALSVERELWGENLLGKALMRVRGILRGQEEEFEKCQSC